MKVYFEKREICKLQLFSHQRTWYPFPASSLSAALHQALNWKKALQTHVQPARDDEDSAETELEASSADRGCIYLIKNTVKL